MNEMIGRLRNTKEAADVLGMREHTLACWRSSGRGPRFRKIGGAVRYAESDLLEFVEKARRGSTSDPGAGL